LRRESPTTSRESNFKEAVEITSQLLLRSSMTLWKVITTP